MQLSTPDQIRLSLFACIDSLLDRRDEFLADPEKRFVRTQKISFRQTMLFPMTAASENVCTELLDFFDEECLPSPSAMIQRRNQIKPSAFRELFLQFNRVIPVNKTFCGHRLIACDGSRLNLPYNPSDPDTFIQCINGRKGINQIHLNTFYDLLNDYFLDVELQSVHSMNEKGAFCRMIDRNADSGSSPIYIGDRGYASYNIFAHAIHNGQLFLIRVPASFADSIRTGNGHWLEEETEDHEIRVHIGRCRKKNNRQLENYHCIPSKGHYDFIEARSDQVDLLNLRVLKFPVVDDSYEYIVTNLPKYAFSIDRIKELYRLRWGVETAFRHLKYAGNMVHIHSLKKEFLIQEIYGKLTMYNVSSCIAFCVEVKEAGKNRKYDYVINHTQLQKICLRFIRGKIEKVADLIGRFLVPIRPGRSFERKLRRQSADTLAYR